MIWPEPGAEVVGELFFLDAAVYRETMAQCDRLEEIPAGRLGGDWYVRRVVEVETANARHCAWAYVDADASG